ncbi:MAG: CesT family type III secretion system chaperone [Pseudomonadota bacterium]
MLIKQAKFTELAREAGIHLGLPEPEMIANGQDFFIDGVTCQVTFNEIRSSVYFTCEIGDPEPDMEVEVYRQILEMQLLMMGGVDAMFARDGINDRLLFVTRLPLDQEVEAVNLAKVMTGVAAQVQAWQETVLSGKLIDYGREFDKIFPEADAGAGARA